MRKDNAGKLIKLAMREEMLKKIAEPRILETHGGKGELGDALYLSFSGVVFEKNEEKAKYLVEKRPHWAIYECDCVKAMKAGVGFHHKPNFIDCDPYGKSMDIVKAIFQNADKLPDTVGIVVNDGARRNIELGCAWKTKDYAKYVKMFGNNGVYDNFEWITRDMFENIVTPAGFLIKEWSILSSGIGGQMTQYAAVLKKKKPAKRRASG